LEKIRREKNREKEDVKKGYLTFISSKPPHFADATELLVNYIKSKKYLHTTKVDEKSEIWVYDNGIYVPHGKSEIKEILRDVLEEYYTTFVYNNVLAKIEPDTFIDYDKFFSSNDKFEIPVENGILNIITRQLTEFSPEKVFFNKLPVKYDKEATCIKIDSFLGDILADEGDRKVIYEIAGFCLLKEYTFEKAFMMVGNGRNGKGKTIELLKRLVGAENTVSIPLSSLDPENFSISELFGKLVNLAGDLNNQDLKETGMFKQLTGRDIVSGKRKFLNNINYINYAKFVFACNELPMVYDMSKGFWDRWILIEFPFEFTTKEEYEEKKEDKKYKLRDEDIINKITVPEEMSGFLNAALNGLDSLFKNRKFSSTKGTDEIKTTWIRKSNSFISFCMDYLEPDYSSKISKRDIRRKYVDYCKEHKVIVKSDIVIKRVLGDTFGATEERTTGFNNMNEWFWEGIKWKGGVN
jgi:putative DNA primase/helicase